MTSKTPQFPRQRTAITVLCALMAHLSVAEAVTIPLVPLQAINSAEPNIMMILDDSGSMQWEAMPDNMVYSYYIYPRPNNLYGGTTYANEAVDTNLNNRYARVMRSSAHNKIYYDPTITYRPWSYADGTLWPNANPTAAYHNPANTALGTRNLTTDLTEYATWQNDGGTNTRNQTYFPATYFKYNGGNMWNAGSYTRVEIKPANAPFTKATTRTDCAGTTCTYAEEIQNFANWYTYYRSRILTARAGIGRAFSLQGNNIRVGFGSINKGSATIDGVATPTVISGVRQFTGTDRSNFFSQLYNWTIPAAGTPLRAALDNVGKYYKRTDDKGPWSSTPGVSGGTDYTCRQSYTIMMTDGYWNGSGASAPANANNDGTSGPTQSGPNGQTYSYSAVSPFTDSVPDTLADVAMYYWKNDLRPDLANQVPTNYLDPAFWQHMVTFGVGLGVTGSVNATAAFDAIQTGATINWPNPHTGGNPALLDDLLHASVNGRGGFFSAQNPKEFADSLTATLNAIAQRSGSAASIAANSSQISTNTKVFNAKFDTSRWSGELDAYAVTSTGVANTPSWTASSNIPAPGARKIFTKSGSSVVSFLFSNLSATDQGYLVNADNVNYLRGDRSKERQNGGTLRNRTSILGDIVDSTPAYVSENDTLFVGANDGMLHAFNATTGVEQFAYIPSAVLPRLVNLTYPAYSHEYFVDGDIAVSSRTQTPNNNYLVATLGRGGKGLFALNVTTPSSFGAGNLLWEYFNASDNDLGYMLGAPIIARMNDGSVVAIVANGYNSSSGKAVLYIFDLATGSILKKFDTGVGSDNGLAAPGVYDVDNDGDIDVIYAGDLKGNLWKFDVSSNTPSAWGFAFMSGTTPLPFFVATDSLGNRQPITAPVSVAKNSVTSDANYGKRFIYVGTGSYFRNGDTADSSVQSLYGLIDQNYRIPGRGNLTPRTVELQGVQSNMPVRVFSESTPGDMTNKDGWYIDLKTAGGVAEGERIVTAAQAYQLAEPTLIFSSIIPIDDPCQPGGRGYVNAINPFTGGRLSTGFFDLNANRNFTDDLLSNRVVGSVDLGIGMPSQPKIVGGRLVVGGSSGKIGDIGINTGAKKTRRISWREISRD